MTANSFARIFGVAPWASLVVTVFAASTAHADPSGADRALADSLFIDAKRLMNAGNYAEACPKLAESERLDPGGGTLLNLAVCHENEGRTATAWLEFKEALAWARRDARSDRAQLAFEHGAALEPKLAHLTITVDPKADVQGLAMTLDGAVVAKPAWGTAVPVDPGVHVIAATAPGKKRRETRVTISQIGATQAFTFEPLEEAEAPASAPPVQATSVTEPASEAPRSNGNGQRVAGFVVGGVGLVTIGVGSVLGLDAIAKRKDSDARCVGACDAEGVRLNDDAKQYATASNIAFGIGLVGVGVGTVLVLTAGHGESKRAFHVAPQVGRTNGVSVGGAF